MVRTYGNKESLHQSAFIIFTIILFSSLSTLFISMSNNGATFPQLEPNLPKKKRGRPKGSKNKRPTRRRRQLDVAGIDTAFEAALRHVHQNVAALPSQPTPSIRQPENQRDSAAPASAPPNEVENEEEEKFHFQILQANNNDDYESDKDVIEEGEVGFGAADMYDVTELLEMGSEIIDEFDDSMDPDKIINSLKHGCVAKSSQRSYSLSLVTFIMYIYEFDR